MTGMEGAEKPAWRVRQHYFVARELQLSIALLIVFALLGGVFLQSLVTAITSYIGVKTPLLGIILIVGYVVIIVALAIVFSHRLVGPFKRLEHEMRFIKAGALERRLSIRTRDDLHVRNFVHHVNEMVGNFEEMSKAYNKLNSTISTGLAKVIEELSKEKIDRELIKKELKTLQLEIHRYREKW
jgi:methyl-accepting chemotaxis protein